MLKPCYMTLSRASRIGKKLEALITQEGAEIVKYEDTFFQQEILKISFLVRLFACTLNFELLVRDIHQRHFLPVVV